MRGRVELVEFVEFAWKPVRESFGVMMTGNPDRAMFITSGGYTDEALRFADGNRQSPCRLSRQTLPLNRILLCRARCW
ncbi:MAG: restriction endonuclease [Limisphaerales bacterium]